MKHLDTIVLNMTEKALRKLIKLSWKQILSKVKQVKAMITHWRISQNSQLILLLLFNLFVNTSHSIHEMKQRPTQKQTNKKPPTPK